MYNYSTVSNESTSSSASPRNVQHVTIIRPVKGVEPYLYECLAATFNQDYPREKLTVHFCVSSRDDSAFPILERLLDDFPIFDARILVEDEDPALHRQNASAPKMGPNPKIRNMSRSYREAKGDIVWIIDCNVWVGSGVCGRMVDRLCGLSRYGSRRPYKFVHQLPICVDVDSQLSGHEIKDFANGDLGSHNAIGAPVSHRSWFSVGGGRLEELFLSSSHAKFYTAINTVAIAPCIIGKSNMFRRSHLNYVTSSTPNSSRNLSSSAPGVGEGTDFFSHNICEDHLIGDLLWRRTIRSAPRLGNHALLLGDLAVQPIANMSVPAYIARRIRWLRVRKFTVTLATLIEPGTESFLCSAYGAFAITTLQWFKLRLGIPQTWTAFVVFWLFSVSAWALVDWTVYILLHSGRTFEFDKKDVPAFVRPPKGLSRRPFTEWLAAWLGRETLALPIWIWAFWCGVTVVWRGRKFWVGMDMRVHEVKDDDHDKRKWISTSNGSVSGDGHRRNKDRRD
jgi:ceramide glucosyltransferase